jgi:hypothetical protein
VRFTTAQGLADSLYASLADGNLKRELGRYGKFDLLIIDELGFLSLDKTASNHFVQVINQAYGHLVNGELGTACDWRGRSPADSPHLQNPSSRLQFLPRPKLRPANVACQQHRCRACLVAHCLIRSVASVPIWNARCGPGQSLMATREIMGMWES